MFTGIVQTMGRVAAVKEKGGDVELVIEAPGLDLISVALGDSIACSGCCLTVTHLSDKYFSADVSRETLHVTTLGEWQVGTEVNLEKALRAGDALGGHYVSGHVDGVGVVVEVTEDSRSVRVAFEVAKGLGRFIASKGSVCVDGISLTVNAVQDSEGQTRFTVNLIPHTLAHTTAKRYRVGARVNVEIDMMARYIERMREAT